VTDRITKHWVLDASDELAVRNGCRFDESRAQHVMQFFEQQLVLYEGDCAGQPFRLMDWQALFLSRLFGWVRYSKHFGREVRRFRKASLWVPKKNGKSPTGAGIGLYLLVADGELGQKVFSAARDGRQAGIMHMHARQMVLQSPALRECCTINKSTGRITHEPTRSWYEIMSADNVRSQEGYNGSVIIDETHVVDDRLAKVLEYAGASRAEPLQVELSTAGDTPEGYGKRQWDYGQAVADGRIKDDSFLYVAYAAPQDASDKELAKKKTWRAANPSMGVTVNEEEFAASLKRAKRTPHDWAVFKKYRFNIWQNSANPWFNLDDDWWPSQDTETDIKGYECVAGLDLSRTRDMSALVLLIRVDDHLHQRAWFWLPEQRAREIEEVGIASISQWEKDGWLEVTPGNVIDYQYIEDRVAKLAQEYYITRLVFDPRFAEELTQRIEMNYGIQRVALAQSAAKMTPPIDEYERQVLAHTIHHDGNPVLAWQAGNVKVHTYPSGVKMLVKPDFDQMKSIDGIVAAVIAMSEAMAVDSVGKPAIY